MLRKSWKSKFDFHEFLLMMLHGLNPSSNSLNIQIKVLFTIQLAFDVSVLKLSIPSSTGPRRRVCPIRCFTDPTTIVCHYFY